MWSDKKCINYIVNILLFAVAINLFHYGQFFLPVICLILFIDNHFQFRVSNLKSFILLCFFSISFFLFSYRMGFYSVMGFCLPMAYYIGSNLKENSEENMKKLLYLLAFGMAAHLVLNLFLEFYYWHDDLSYMFNKPSHYDFWLRGKVRTTVMSTNYLLILSCVYYLFRFERNRVLKWIGFMLFALSSVYCVALGRRTTFLILLLSLFFACTYDLLFITKKISRKHLIRSFVAVLMVAVSFYFDLFHINEEIRQVSLIQRFIHKGLFTERFTILKESLPLFFKYFWGGQQIGNETGYLIHDLWGDIYDYAGIIPFLCVLSYSFMVLTNICKTNVKKEKSAFHLLIFDWFISCSLIFFLEPVMTGSSIYLICYIIIAACLDFRKKSIEIV